VFRGSQAVACGALSSGQLRGPQTRQLCRDVYTCASRPLTHQLRCRAYAMALPSSAVITGRSAATVRGVRLAWPEDPIQVVVPPDTRLGHRRGLDVRRTVLTPADWCSWAGGRLATPMRLTLDLLLGRPLPDAVADLDAVLRARLVRRDAVAAMVAARSDKGIVGARRAVELADPLAESLPESKVRVVLRQAGLEPVTQYWIVDRHGNRVVRVDLAFPEHRLAVEYDGDWRDGEAWALNRDRARLNQVRDLGWDVVFVTAPMLRDHHGVVCTVRAALLGAAHRSGRCSEPSCC
jgi:very-short-patch-repair endonuclease